MQALHGMGGVGKTQLAAEYAHRFAEDYDLAWWINADQSSLIGDQIASLGHGLGCLPPGSGSESGRAAVLADLRQRGRWLLIFDNAGAPADVMPWLPGGSGHVLITSRERGWDEIAAPVEIDLLTRPESIEMLAAQDAGTYRGRRGPARRCSSVTCRWPSPRRPGSWPRPARRRSQYLEPAADPGRAAPGPGCAGVLPAVAGGRHVS